MEGVEDDDDNDTSIPKPKVVYIPNPKNQQEYAQNVRNFVRAQVLSLSDGVIEVRNEIKPFFDIHTAWVQSELKIKRLEQSLQNLTVVMPGMRVQLEKQIAQARREQPARLNLDQEVRYLELISEMGHISKLLNSELETLVKRLNIDSDTRINGCVECGTMKNITHQEKYNSEKVFCSNCVLYLEKNPVHSSHSVVQ